MIIIQLSIFLLILALSPNGSHSFQILSCTDSPTTVPSTSWKSNVSPLKTQITRSSSTSNNNNKSHESWYYEGISPTSGGEVILSYEDADLKKRGSDVKFYLEYLNESPRRVAVENVKSDLGGPVSSVLLLPGDASDNTGWRSGIYPILLGSTSDKLKLTAVLKKPQRLYIRKLVLVQSPPGPVTRSLTDLLKTKSCEELAEMQKQTTTTKPAPVGLSSFGGGSPTPTPRTPPTQCKNNKSTQMGDDSCSVCPECRCVCNCNCNKEGC